MMNTPGADKGRRRFGSLFACLVSCLAGGCSQERSPAPVESPPVTAAASVPTGSIVKGTADRDEVLAGLKKRGIDLLTTQNVEVKSFRYTGLRVPMEWFVEIEQKPALRGQEMLRISLPPGDEEEVDGTLNLVLLPPASTGKEGMQVILQTVPDGGGGGRWVVESAPPLWFGWPKGRARAQTRLDGGPLSPKPGRTYKLIGYSAQNPGAYGEAFLTLRCKAGKPSEPHSGAAKNGSVQVPRATRPGAPQ